MTVRIDKHGKESNVVGARDFFDERPLLLVAIMVLLFVSAAVIRLYDVESPGYAVDREYRSATIARSYYFSNNASIDDWRRDIAIQARQNRPLLEPPVTEMLVSLIYRIIGSDALWSARFLTSAFWLVGGIFLLATARRLVSTTAALFALAYYLLVPLGVLMSRSFQPDSLMMLVFLAALFIIVAYHERPSLPRLLVAGFISAFAILYRPQITFVLLGAFIALAIYKDGIPGIVFKGSFWLFMAISLTPAIFYYGYAALVAGILDRQVSMVPQLFFRRAFWKDWLQTGMGAVGFTALIGALFGSVFLRRQFTRALLIGLGVGYLVFAVIFNYYIRAIAYYHLQLIPIIAFPLGALLAFLFNNILRSDLQRYWWAPLAGAFLLILFTYVTDVRGRLWNARFESKEVAQEIGEIVEHSSRVVYVSRSYGMPLQYYAEITGAFWPRRYSDRDQALGRPQGTERSIGERLDSLGFTPEYFVITHFSEFDRHHADFKSYLQDNCLNSIASDDYLVYSECHKQQSAQW